MQPNNFKCTVTGEECYIQKFRTIMVEGKPQYRTILMKPLLHPITNHPVEFLNKEIDFSTPPIVFMSEGERFEKRRKWAHTRALDHSKGEEGRWDKSEAIKRQMGGK